jgi:hypothetical protein
MRSFDFLFIWNRVGSQRPVWEDTHQHPQDFVTSSLWQFDLAHCFEFWFDMLTIPNKTEGLKGGIVFKFCPKDPFRSASGGKHVGKCVCIHTNFGDTGERTPRTDKFPLKLKMVMG